MTAWPPSLPKGSGYFEIQHPVLSRCSVHREPVSAVLRYYRSGELRIPDYQRPLVWSDRQQAEFVGALLEGGPTPAIFIREVDGQHGFEDELVDGQQRINALVRWEDGDIPAILPSQNRCVWKKDLDWPGWRLNVCFPTGRFQGTRAEALSIYLAINTKGVPHTQEELDRVRDLLAEETA